MLGQETGGECDRGELFVCWELRCDSHQPCAKQKQTGGNLSHRGRWVVFTVPVSHLLYFSINAPPSLISQCHPSPYWGAGGRGQDSSLPKTVLPLHFLAQAYQVHHCSACSHDKAIQHPVLSALCWKEPQGNDLTYVHLHGNSSHFSHPWCCSLSRPCKPLALLELFQIWNPLNKAINEVWCARPHLVTL